MCVCVCARARARARAYVGVCARVRACMCVGGWGEGRESNEETLEKNFFLFFKSPRR